ncbi:MAG: hypothetical protein ABR525_02815 [Candidatus Limnocylindria bacterium]
MRADGAAHADYRRARRKAFWRGIGSWLTRADNALLAFEDVRRQLKLQSQHEGGLREVPIEQKRDVPFDEAVASWYDRVYLPTVEAVRSTDALRDFSNRSEADLYLWITEHHWYVHRAAVPEREHLEDVVRGYARERSERPLKRLRRSILVSRRRRAGPA